MPAHNLLESLDDGTKPSTNGTRQAEFGEINASPVVFSDGDGTPNAKNILTAEKAQKKIMKTSKRLKEVEDILKSDNTTSGRISTEKRAGLDEEASRLREEVKRLTAKVMKAIETPEQRQARKEEDRKLGREQEAIIAILHLTLLHSLYFSSHVSTLDWRQEITVTPTSNRNSPFHTDSASKVTDQGMP